MLKIVLSGGPGSGKSTMLAKLKQTLEEKGFYCFICPETASELILNGIRPCKNISGLEFQKLVVEKQLAKEDLYDKAVMFYDPDKVVIIYDRGLFDSCAYITKDKFERILKQHGLTLSAALNRYNAVLDLVTAADGAEAYYQWNDPNSESDGNNPARSESPELAREKDKLTLNAWIGHPHLRVFDNSTDFQGKIDRVLNEVFSLLGTPVPKEMERKFLVKYPTPEEISGLGCCSVADIIQTYLVRNDPNVERRIRQRGNANEGFTFFYTEKKNISHIERIEVEKIITPSQYINYMTEADIAYHQISKKRYCFVYDRKYFELDVYPFSDEYAILEIEINDPNESFEVPSLIHIVKEVTDCDDYKNSNLAKTLTIKA